MSLDLLENGEPSAWYLQQEIQCSDFRLVLLTKEGKANLRKFGEHLFVDATHSLLDGDQKLGTVLVKVCV